MPQQNNKARGGHPRHNKRKTSTKPAEPQVPEPQQAPGLKTSASPPCTAQKYRGSLAALLQSADTENAKAKPDSLVTAADAGNVSKADSTAERDRAAATMVELANAGHKVQARVFDGGSVQDGILNCPETPTDFATAGHPNGNGGNIQKDNAVISLKAPEHFETIFAAMSVSPSKEVVEQPTIHTSHPAVMDPAFGQAAAAGRRRRHDYDHDDDGASEAGSAGAASDKARRAVELAISELPPPRSAAQRRRTPEEFHQTLLNQFKRVRAVESSPERLLGCLAELRDYIDERMSEFVDIDGVMFDLGCGGPWR